MSLERTFKEQKYFALQHHYSRLRHELSIDVCAMLDLDDAIQARTANLALASNGTVPRYTTAPEADYPNMPLRIKSANDALHNDATALVLTPGFEILGTITAHGRAQLERDEDTNHATD